MLSAVGGCHRFTGFLTMNTYTLARAPAADKTKMKRQSMIFLIFSWSNVPVPLQLPFPNS
jgi:hypothetical protein